MWYKFTKIPSIKFQRTRVRKDQIFKGFFKTVFSFRWYNKCFVEMLYFDKWKINLLNSCSYFLYRTWNMTKMSIWGKNDSFLHIYETIAQWYPSSPTFILIYVNILILCLHIYQYESGTRWVSFWKKYKLLYFFQFSDLLNTTYVFSYSFQFLACEINYKCCVQYLEYIWGCCHV